MKVHERFPPRAIVAADGPWLIDDQGHRILDAVSSWWVNLFGHNFGPIREAITDQLGKLDHIMLAGLTHPPVVELSERLADAHRLGPRVLRQRRGQRHRDRAEDERPQLAQPGAAREKPVHRPARRLPR
jgi:acetylornithine/succinyldiaminopimelate/putrescine aminotransferase